MKYALLGQFEVVDDDGVPVDLGGRRPKVLLAALLLAAPRPVRAEALIDIVWSGEPPASASGTLQTYVSRLRRRFEAASGGDSLGFADGGYRMQIDPSDLDITRFEALADNGRQLLDEGRVAASVAALDEAIALWRGPALVDFADEEFASGRAARLEERRFTAIEDRLAAHLALGHHSAVIGELAELVGAHPLREGLQAKYALALYRSGRQADALRALAEAGRTLREELGIEPSRPLRELEAAILAHDPALDAIDADPLADADAISPTTTATAPVRPASDLVGREGELAALVALYEESVGDARIAVLEGEPGIGKTRLADELRSIAQARGSLAVWGRSDESGAAPALWPWLAPLRALSANVAQVPPALAALFAGESAAVPAGYGAAMQFERFDAVAELLHRAGATAPVVVLLDDLQWADATSLELLGYLAGRLGPGVLIVATMRQLVVGSHDSVREVLAAIARRPGSRRITVQGLSSDATARMLAGTGHNVAPATAAAIHERAEGNPFYAIELGRLVDDDGGLHGVPSTVGDVVRVRLAQLPAATVRLLEVAAVAGRDVDLELLARSAGMELADCIDTIEPAVLHRLLIDAPEQPGLLRFSHALVREVLLDGLTSLRRARLHLQVADAIEAAGPGLDAAELLAEHLWQAASVGVGRRAAAALERAAQVAVRRVSYQAAESLLERAVRLRRSTGTTRADQEAELAAIYQLLEVSQATRYFQGVGSFIDRAKELADELGEHDVLRSLIWYEWAQLATASQLGRVGALAATYRALTVDDPRPEVRSSGYEVVGVLHWTRGEITKAAEQLDIAYGLIRGDDDSGDALLIEQRLVTNAFWLVNHAYVGDHSVEMTFDGFEEMLARFPQRVSVASICGFASSVATTMGVWEQAERFTQIGLSADPKLQFAFWAGQLRMYQGILQVRRGDVDEGAATFEDGRSRYMGLGGHSGMPVYVASLAYQLGSQGKVEEAAAAAAYARDLLVRRDERWNEPVVLIGEAVAALAAGDRVTATATFVSSVEVATRQGSYALADRARSEAAHFGLSLPDA